MLHSKHEYFTSLHFTVLHKCELWLEIKLAISIGYTLGKKLALLVVALVIVLLEKYRR